jgi:DNA-binding CsgD family transcriptional regulator
VYTNHVAATILKKSTEIRVQSGRLHLNDAKLDSELARLVREAVRTAGGSPLPPGRALAIERAGRLPITALVTPMRPASNARITSAPAAMIFMRDPEDAAPAQETLRELFGLTKTEAAITAELANGQSLEQIATRFAIGIGTVRSHVKTILSKTGTHRQAQLVALVARSVASIGAPRPPL